MNPIKQLFGDSADRCDNCKYYRQANDQGGWCMQAPPTVVMIQQETVGGVKITPAGARPTTEKGAFCSHHTHMNRYAPQKTG